MLLRFFRDEHAFVSEISLLLLFHYTNTYNQGIIIKIYAIHIGNYHFVGGCEKQLYELCGGGIQVGG
jgi:hypothetical protein